jgi:hypothetical protein
MCKDLKWTLHIVCFCKKIEEAAVSIEGGLGRSFLEGAATLGIAFDAQRKMTADDPGELQPVFDMLNIGKH